MKPRYSAKCYSSPGTSGAASVQALSRYTSTELPVYAIKEFKAGALRNIVWFHNKLVSFWRTIDALQRMSLTPKRYTTATALEALREAAKKIGRVTTGKLVEVHGPHESLDSVLKDRFRLALKHMAGTRLAQKAV